MAENEIVQQPSQDGEKAGEALVDDLADAGDYWLSITDAARVTRRQEITIRRWIAVGELPVRRQRMGLNKRTRHVRASDLARITPIIDPAAAITGAPAQVDLLSIPHQQADLLQRQQHLEQAMTDLIIQTGDQVQQVQEQLQQAMDRDRQESARFLQETRAAHQQFAHQLAQEGQRWQSQLQSQRECLEQQIAEVTTTARATDAELAQQMSQTSTTLTRVQELVALHHQEVQRRLDDLRQQIMQHGARLDQQEQDLQARLRQQDATFAHRLDQVHRRLVDALDAHATLDTQQMADISRWQQQIDERLAMLTRKRRRNHHAHVISTKRSRRASARALHLEKRPEDAKGSQDVG